MAEKHDPLDPSHLMAHVQDADYFEVPRALSSSGHLVLPQPFKTDTPLLDLPLPFEALDFRLTKFMVAETVAATLVAIVFIVFASKIRGGRPPQGRLWNMLEAMLLYIRDQVARPAIGHHDGDKFLPFLWTIFFFVLGCNLLGLVPFMGTATGAFATTCTLAVITFCTVLGAGMAKMGPAHFWVTLVPHMDLPPALRILLWPMIFLIELMGLFIKHFVLAVRLFANMFAGHLVLAVLLAFISATAGSIVWWGVTPASIFGAVALSLLELFVAFLQAFIFTYLSALFIGTAVHPH